VDASDPSGIRDVVVSVDDAVACTLTVSPFTCTVRVGPGKHTISVRATDRAGNSATASRGVFAKKNVRSLASVSSLSPKSGSSVGRAFTLRAATTKDAMRVTFAVDGAQRCVDARAPFMCRLSTTPGMHRVVLRVASRAGSTTYRAVFRVR
jgi:hypothetical protein